MRRTHWDFISNGDKVRPRKTYTERQEIVYIQALKAAAKEISAATGQRVSPPTIERTIVLNHEPTVAKYYKALRGIRRSEQEKIERNEGWG